jgi:hypothetical protein
VTHQLHIRPQIPVSTVPLSICKSGGFRQFYRLLRRPDTFPRIPRLLFVLQWQTLTRTY